MKPIFIYAVSVLYCMQGFQLVADKQFWPAILCFVYALAGVPLIMMVQR